MSRSRLFIVAVPVLAVAGCDRLEQQWPLQRAPSAVTVKLPPPKAASPGFAFNEGKKHGTSPLR